MTDIKVLYKKIANYLLQYFRFDLQLHFFWSFFLTIFAIFWLPLIWLGIIASSHPIKPNQKSSQLQCPLLHRSKDSLTMVATSPSHTNWNQNIANIVRKKDQKKCSCRSNLKHCIVYFAIFLYRTLISIISDVQLLEYLLHFPCLEIAVIQCVV